MPPFFSWTALDFSRGARRGVFLLALGALAPAARGQDFGPPNFYSTGTSSNPVEVVLRDVNGDGKADLITANSSTNGVGVLLGTVSGFGPAALYFTGAVPTFVAVGDLNGDGRADLVASNQGSNTVGVLLGQGNGGFAPVQTYATGAGGSSLGLAMGDVNGDGAVDLVVAKYTAHAVGVLYGMAGGGFAAPVTYSTGAVSAPTRVAVGDLNGDGRLDIVTSNYGSNTAGVLLGQVGGFAPVATYSTGTFGLPCGIALGDMNGDGRLDIVTANYGNDTAGVLLGVAGGFAPVVEHALRSTPPGMGALVQPLSVDLGDVNRDGRLDVVANSGNTRTVRVLLGQGSGGFAPVRSYPAGNGSGPSTIALGDVNGDQWLDIATAHGGADLVGVLLNSGTFAPLATAGPTAADVALAPNPARGAFTVQLPATFGPAVAVELVNGLGQVVRRPQAAGPRFTVETAALAPGVYTLRLWAGGATLVKRVVVE